MAKKNKIDKITENTDVIKKATVNISLQDRHKRIWDALIYSHQRIDILLIAISGGGIYVCFETIKYFLQKGDGINLTIKLSAIFFLATIVINLISQWCSSNVHEFDYTITYREISCIEDNDDFNKYKDEINKYECKISVYNKAAKYLLISSFISMLTGLILLTAYFLIIF